MTRFFLVRHGETEWNRAYRLQSRNAVPLNETGREQVAWAGHALLVMPPATCSSARRCLWPVGRRTR